MENQKSSNKKVLVLVERKREEIAPITFELLNAGKELAVKQEGTLCTAVLGYKLKDILNEIAYFSDETYFIENALLLNFDVDFYVYAFEKLCRTINPSVILMGHTNDNLDLAPRLAFKLDVKLVTDCISLDIEPKNSHLLCTKPIYGGNAVAIFETIKKPHMVTVRPKVFQPIGHNLNKGKIISFDLPLEKSIARTEIIDEFLGQSVNIENADVIVAGGRGIKTIDGIKLLEELIEALKKYFDKVELGGTRPLVQSSLIPRSRQIGQTGEKVNPQLYIAIGISGSSQHLSGVVGSKKIVAVNRDADAPIFDAADYGIVGQYENIIPTLIKKLKELS